jgi:hypothetical protein
MELLSLQLLKGYYVCVQLDKRPVRKNRLFGPSMTEKFLSAYSDKTQNDLRIWISQKIQIYIWK